MFEPLPDVIRNRRRELGLSQGSLAKMAGVSRGQLALLERGCNVSLLFLLKIARALQLTELPVAEVRLVGAEPELDSLLCASEVVLHARRALAVCAAAEKHLDGAAASLDEMVERARAVIEHYDEIEP